MAAELAQLVKHLPCNLSLDPRTHRRAWCSQTSISSPSCSSGERGQTERVTDALQQGSLLHAVEKQETLSQTKARTDI